MDLKKGIAKLSLALSFGLILLFQNCGELGQLSANKFDLPLTKQCLTQMSKGHLVLLASEQIDSRGRLFSSNAKVLIQTPTETIELQGDFAPESFKNLAGQVVHLTADEEEQFPAVQVIDSSSGIASQSRFFFLSSHRAESVTEDSSNCRRPPSPTTTNYVPPPVGQIVNTFPLLIPAVQKVNQKVLVIRARGPQSPPTKYSNEQLAEFLFSDDSGSNSVRQVYRRETKDRILIEGGLMLGPLESSQSCYHNVLPFLTEAKGLIESSMTAADFQEYDHIVFTLPTAGSSYGCQTSQAASFQVPYFESNRYMGVSFNIEYDNAETLAMILAHELGHSMGLNHAYGMGSEDPLHLRREPMVFSQYFDLENMMGQMSVNAGLNSVQLERLGAVALPQVKAVNTPGNFRIFSLERYLGSDKVVHLKIPMSQGDGYFSHRPFLSVEYKNGSRTTRPGVYIRTSNLESQSALFYDPTSPNRRSILETVGQSFIDEMNGKKILLTAIDQDSVQLQVEDITPSPAVILNLQAHPLGFETADSCRILKVRGRSPVNLTEDIQVTVSADRYGPMSTLLGNCRLAQIGQEFGCDIQLENLPNYRDVYLRVYKTIPETAGVSAYQHQQFHAIGSWNCL
jgi:hypothetical protein